MRLSCGRTKTEDVTAERITTMNRESSIPLHQLKSVPDDVSISKENYNQIRNSNAVNDNYGTFYEDYGNYASSDAGSEEAAWMQNTGNTLLSRDDDGESHTAATVKIGSFQAGWNVTNAIQGMFIVSLPYTILHGGFWSIFALVLVAYVCYYTGLILVECLYDENGVRRHGSYKAVAEVCWGKRWGGILVFSAQMIELLMTCILYIVLCGDLMENSFPTITTDKMGWMLLSAAALLPCAFLRDLRAVSWLSFWNAVTHVLINLIVVIYCFTRASQWTWSSLKITVNSRTFPTVLGIIVFSYTSHIFLPSLEGSMEDRRQFRTMLKWSHFAAALFKALFALFGFLTFGEFTEEEVTNNLPSQQFKAVINVILVLKALLSYPLPYFTIVQLLEELLFHGNQGSRFPSCFWSDTTMKDWALALRICLVLFTLFMAITTPHFALLMGLVGNITGTLLSFVWPCVFHLKLKRQKLSKYAVYCDWAILTFGILFGLIGIYFSSTELYRAIQVVDEYS
ncbi:Vesicular GABA transporter [Trichinella papuae]|uniref:Vesicular inhibitory amino acid transporter n=1 Tax=Trichinella papuae TaxID=268474 RepID=A0A0V1MKP7_9BILA|nr:Vesicular GABA transporter [Trichinella papuae]